VGEPSPTTELFSPKQTAAYWKSHISKAAWYDPEREQLVLATVNAKMKTTGFYLISLGNINSTIADPREIFRAALLANAYGFFLMHNHPSGETQPSSADRQITKTVIDGAKILNLTFYDHIIVGKKSYYSFREHETVIFEKSDDYRG
jgi:DNA repair protein RadC